MRAVHGPRVLGGGLLAGLVYNAGETLSSLAFADQLREMAARHALREPDATGIALFVLHGFAVGVIIVWLYALVRQALGAGPRTALLVGLVAWYLTSFAPNLAWMVFGLSSLRLGAVATAVGLAELSLAALAGTAFYRDR